MKIAETITRECCQWGKDLETYKGVPPKQFPIIGNASRVWFCKHCGQLWHNHRQPGEMDAGLERLDIAWTGN